MVIKIGQNHMFELIKNTKDAFNIETFDSKYLPEYFEIYHYLAGDISSGITRLKGFIKKNTEEETLKEISSYFSESCSLRCPVFIVRKIDEEEFVKLSENPREVDTYEEKTIVLEKENFDKESLVLQSTPSSKPTIVIDPKKMNAIPKGFLPTDISEIIKEESRRAKENKHSNNLKNNNSKPINNRVQNNKQQNNNGSNKNKNNNSVNNNGIKSNNKPNNNNFKNNKKHFNKGNGK